MGAQPYKVVYHYTAVIWADDEEQADDMAEVTWQSMIENNEGPSVLEEMVWTVEGPAITDDPWEPNEDGFIECTNCANEVDPSEIRGDRRYDSPRCEECHYASK